METQHLQERLKDFPLINKKKSVIDEKRSNPKKGLFIFREGEKERYKLKTGTNKLAPYWYHWVRNDPVRINRLKVTKGYDFVTKNDDIVPEGIALGEEGFYQYGDLVLMRCDLERKLMRMKRSRERSDIDLKATISKYIERQKMDNAELDKELLKDIAGELADIAGID